ncbi:MAG TPA: cation diffusion facilitator family transporter [Candidatus Omnitrophota bacterium]|nr:cation diffusion facilitator family transporter [Candidatus Omnitrophota bacterium]HPD84448.1 cation diffusion facilitator family transporter [Candidatus Omnitrophota bacterium]HRZ03306.1 cation diffusion facilitator family transporter [Candidatus Omnitrophota bacterium]
MHEKNPQGRYDQIKRVLWLILLLNWSVAAAKIIYGLITNFGSMTADGFHSLADGASNIIGLIGITIASQPADKDHPYGHKKYETLFSLAIAGFLFFTCYNLVISGIKRLHEPVIPQIDSLSFTVMIITMAVNIFVMRYEYKQGKRFNSDILISDSLHTRTDIFTSFSVIIALIVSKIGFNIIDPIVTMLIALFIAYAAFSIVRESSGVLCDTAVILDEQKIETLVSSIKGVKSCHKIRSRGRPDDIHVDLHIQVNSHMHVDEAHRISHEISGAIKNRIPGVTDVVVHIEPKGK